jgi:hypothetical protein
MGGQVLHFALRILDAGDIGENRDVMGMGAITVIDAVDGEPGVGFFKPPAKAGSTLRLGRKILLQTET